MPFFRPLSPCIRGNAIEIINDDTADRSIPACGENFASCLLVITASGPSPRMRGKRSGFSTLRTRRSVHPRACGENFHRRASLGVQLRSIPAHAGKTRNGRIRNAAWDGPSPRMRGKRPQKPERGARVAVHPRACGENKTCPRVSQHPARSIPAHAGKTHLDLAQRLGVAVHPRACGENSNPNARKALPSRSIPAHAGKTLGSYGISGR